MNCLRPWKPGPRAAYPVRLKQLSNRSKKYISVKSSPRATLWIFFRILIFSLLHAFGRYLQTSALKRFLFCLNELSSTELCFVLFIHVVWCYVSVDFLLISLLIFLLFLLDRTREERVKQAQELEEKGQKDEARRVMAQSAQITFDVIKGLIKVTITIWLNYLRSNAVILLLFVNYIIIAGYSF